MVDSNVGKVGMAKSRFPIGSVLPYAGSMGPEQMADLEKSGWLFCDGAAVDRKKYNKLYDVIGDIHGRGDAVKTFNLPDYRGRFLRGVDGGIGRDVNSNKRLPSNVGGLAGDQVGSVQEDAFEKHNHEVTYNNNNYFFETGGAGIINDRGWEAQKHSLDIQLKEAGTEPETRPKNANVNWIIFSG
ncbi:phage tail protein [Mariprofundus sp. EBB-1]|uniref:phage tail protein n=1 Tax=Mariprofundus sp. EBB-1 TaxID=2650971 RepID=UPI0013793EF9|nr:phage tail protein [Mariprofundus sp. EBB-1]